MDLEASCEVIYHALSGVISTVGILDTDTRKGDCGTIHYIKKAESVGSDYYPDLKYNSLVLLTQHYIKFFVQQFPFMYRF